MNNLHGKCILACVLSLGLLGLSSELGAQENKPPADAEAKSGDAASAQAPDSRAGQAYSGMYTFLKEGEFVQVTVEDQGHVTGFVSRFGDGESDKGAFL